MKTAVIIAEYNPFHKGHGWQTETLRRGGYTHIAAVMSGSFVQRGSPALFSKFQRTEMALLGGADLVVELPLPYACATAQRFAFGGIFLADSLGCGDALCFGSECGDLTLLEQTADALMSPELPNAMEPFLAQGLTFAKARSLALNKMGCPQAAEILNQPNNTLGVEYLLSLRQMRSDLKPITFRRQGVGHGDTAGQDGFASATHIRSLLLEGQKEEALTFVPEACRPVLKQAAPVTMDDRLFLSRLRTMSREQLSRLPDCSEGIENRLYQAVRTGLSWEEVIQTAKTKRYPLARIRRLALSAFLGIPASLSQTPPPYLRVLGLNHRGRELLAQMRKTARLPVSGSLAELESLSPAAGEFARLEAQAGDLYNLLERDLLPCGQEYRFSPVRVGL